MSNGQPYEKVTFAASPLNNGEFIPLVEFGSAGNTRPFVSSDMHRVLDFPNMPSPPPHSAPHGHLEFEMDDDDQTIRDDAPPKFPKRFFCLRGSFIFYFDLQDVVASSRDHRRHRQDLPEFLNAPIGVIPLERTTVEFPPGGRRVFREHANTEATQGYELMIRHAPARASTLTSATTAAAAAEGEHVAGGTTPSSTKIAKRRAPAYLVMDSLGQRDAWAEAIRLRAEAYRKETKLRMTGDGSMDDGTLDATTGKDGMMNEYIKGDTMDSATATATATVRSYSPTSRNKFGSRPIGGDISLLAGVIEAEEQKDINEALKTFGVQTFFQEKYWINNFFQKHDEEEGKELCEKLERWQISIKKGLRGAVLEQYEYFVEASKEMTQMGRELASLKELVQKQVEMFESMKRINFNLDMGRLEGGVVVTDAEKGENTTTEDTTRDSSDDDDEDDDDEEEEDDYNEKEFSAKSSYLSKEHQQRQRQPSVRVGKRSVTSPSSKSSSKRSSRTIDVPVWIDDIVDEISALVKEYRYSEAAELLFKAKIEVKDILNLVRNPNVIFIILSRQTKNLPIYFHVTYHIDSP